MSAHLEHVAARVIGRPLLILPQKLDIIAGVLAGRLGLDLEAPELGLDVADRPEPLASRFVGSGYDRDSGRLVYQRTDQGAAIITITGSLVNRGAWIGASSGLTSYEGIAAQLRAALADPRVSSILPDVSSGGGEAIGAFELAAQVRKANAAKPVTAFVNGMAASAAYLMASGAGRIVSIPSGLTGSIGVVMMHADHSRALEKAGIGVTFIHSGARKVDGNPYQPLGPETKARLQAEVDKLREDFVQHVGAGRGSRFSAKAARDTEAGVFAGREAKALGLVDDLASFDDLYAEMKRGAAARPSAAPPGARRASMDELATARAEGAAAERVRFKTILNAPEAKGREGLATHLAYETPDSAAAAIAALRASATASPSRHAPVLDREAIYARLAGREPPPQAAAADRGTLDPATIYARRREASAIDADDIYGRLNGRAHRREAGAGAEGADTRLPTPHEIYGRRRGPGEG